LDQRQQQVEPAAAFGVAQDGQLVGHDQPDLARPCGWRRASGGLLVDRDQQVEIMAREAGVELGGGVVVRGAQDAQTQRREGLFELRGGGFGQRAGGDEPEAFSPRKRCAAAQTWRAGLPALVGAAMSQDRARRAGLGPGRFLQRRPVWMPRRRQA